MYKNINLGKFQAISPLLTKTYIFIADKGNATPLPLTDMSAKSVTFSRTAPLKEGREFFKNLIIFISYMTFCKK